MRVEPARIVADGVVAERDDRPAEAVGGAGGDPFPVDERALGLDRVVGLAQQGSVGDGHHGAAGVQQGQRYRAQRQPVHEVRRAVHRVENPEPLGGFDVGLVVGLLGQQRDVRRGLGQVVGDVTLDGQVDIGYQVAVTLVLHRARLRFLQRRGTDLRCLPSYFKKLLH
ncbi:hypothetical protein MOKP126_00750 [Mycobacterium avium subsp. hominissuis]